MINPVNINNGKMMETDPASLKPFCEHVEKITGERNRLKFKKNDEWYENLTENDIPAFKSIDDNAIMVYNKAEIWIKQVMTWKL